ncbi:MAG TPA: hypothetical protein PKY56_07155 [Candidatus Kapabacteria bacterium]|nr:hypothetical protein [Candidatus Kapabacteria bacterium]HPO62465.1 hypothetical protein [Candidatus Kapabacteria bacterium]
MKLFWFIIFTALLLFSCNDSTEPSKKDKNCLIIIDSFSNQPIADCYVRFDYIFDKDTNYNLDGVMILPNPVEDMVAFQFQITEPGSYSFDIVNQVNNKSYNLMIENFDKTGSYWYKFNLYDSVQIEEGFYSVYLKRENVPIDTMTLFYLKDAYTIDYNSSFQCYSFYAYQNQTDMAGKMNFNPDDFKLFGKYFIKIFMNGKIDGKLTVNDNFLVTVFNSNYDKLSQKIIPFKKLKEGYTYYINN